MLMLYISSTQLTLMAPLDLKNNTQGDVFTLFFKTFDAHACQVALQSFLQKKQFIGRATILAIPMEDILFREIIWDIPFSDWQAYSFIQANFEHYFSGYHLEQCWFDFEKRNVPTEHFSQTALSSLTTSIAQLKIYAAPKTFLQLYITLAEQSGLKIKKIDIDALALETLLNSIFLHPSDSNRVSSMSQLKIVILWEVPHLWIIEYKPYGNIRLQKMFLDDTLFNQAEQLLAFFKSFMGENMWNLSEIFYFKNQSPLLDMMEILKNELKVTLSAIELEALCRLEPYVQSDYLFSRVIHLGLLERHGY